VAKKKPSATHSRRAPVKNSRTLEVLEYTGWVPFACAIAAMITIAFAGITWVTSPYWGNNNAQAKARNVGVVPTTTQANPSPVADIVSPNRIEIPKIHAEAPIVKVGTTPDGELDVPKDPLKVGWWQYGAKPGAAVGTAILAGHINYAGVTGPMATIGKLNPGDEVDVFGQQNADAKHEVKFRVTGVRTYHKTHLPYQEIFDQKSVGRIAIVTCGGPFDASTGNYLDNIVVFAVPDTATPTGLSGPGDPTSPSDTPSGHPSNRNNPSNTPSGNSS
jgi:Sortase domain